jgi:hypothetical protein
MKAQLKHIFLFFILSLFFNFAFAEEPIIAPKFIERMSNIDHRYDGGWEHFVGGGIAAFDCNNDGLLDVYAAGGENTAGLFVNKTNLDTKKLSFKNNTPQILRIKNVTGAYPIDINNDQILDLTVLRVGENIIFKGKGNCEFEKFTALQFLSDDKWTTAFSATWEEGNILPTLVFGNYVDRKNPKGPFETCDVNILYRPDGAHYKKPIELSPGFCTLSMLFSDWSRQGKTDLRISNDRHYYVKNGQEQLWKMQKIPELYNQSEGWQPYKIWGMGIASRDLDFDGISEIYLSSMGDQKLQSLDVKSGKPHYKNAKFDRGISAHRPYMGDDGRPSTGWHVAFGDVQNDGLDDIFIAKGNVDQMPSSAMKDPNNLLIQKSDGTFREFGEEADIADVSRSRGAALHDFNNDGLLDLIVINRREKIRFYENITQSIGNWISVQLSQNLKNKNAIGAWIEVKTKDRIYTREITLGGGHASGSIAPEHFGLGKIDTVSVRVIWPNGTKSDWYKANANHAYEITNNEDEIKLLY